jgi:hypothetical protein
MNSIERDRLTLTQEQSKLDEAYRQKLYEYQTGKDTRDAAENARQFNELRALDKQRLDMEGLSLDRAYALSTAQFTLSVLSTPEYATFWSQTGQTPQSLLDAVQSGKPIPVPQFRGAARTGVATDAMGAGAPVELMSAQQWSQLLPTAQAAERGRIAAAGIPIDDYLAMVRGTVPAGARLP